MIFGYAPAKGLHINISACLPRIPHPYRDERHARPRLQWLANVQVRQMIQIFGFWLCFKAGQDMLLKPDWHCLQTFAGRDLQRVSLACGPKDPDFARFYSR